MTTHCRSCGAEIVWTITGTGKRMPIDAYPADDGNLFVFVRPGMTPESESVASDSPRAREHAALGDAPRFRSHFATCPDAVAHRRKDMAR